MKTNTFSFESLKDRIRLKEPRGWFAAGNGFRSALNLLSDGAFKLFAYLSLQADRRTGRHIATHKELAAALGKSKRIIGRYVTELETKAICKVHNGKNQYAATVYEIADEYWPYHRTGSCAEPPEQNTYVDSVRDCFVELGCTSRKFNTADIQTAKQLQQRDVPLAVIQDAMFLGACRKYSSWLDGVSSEPIQSLAYFERLISEIQEKPFPPGYSAYLRKKVIQLAERWHGCLGSRHKTRDMASPEIVE
jgi:hypothetical protein